MIYFHSFCIKAKTFKTKFSFEFILGYHSQIWEHSPLTVDIFYVSDFSCGFLSDLEGF